MYTKWFTIGVNTYLHYVYENKDRGKQEHIKTIFGGRLSVAAHKVYV